LIFLVLLPVLLVLQALTLVLVLVLVLLTLVLLGLLYRQKDWLCFLIYLRFV
jgi:hypothetical protein